MTTATIRRRAIAVPPIAAGGGVIAGLMALAHLSNDALTSMLSALLPSLQVGLDLSETTMALLVGTLAFSSSVTQPVFGALSDRFGTRRVAALGTAFGVSIMSLMTIAPNAAVLFVLLLVGGLGSAAFHPAGSSVVGTASERRRELALSTFAAAGTIGLAIGPLLVLGIAASLGLAFTPWLILPAIALGFAMYAVIPESSPGPRGPRPPLLDRRLLTGPVGLLAAVATLSSIPFVAFSAAYPLFLVRVHGVPATDPLLGATLAVFSLAAAGGAVAAAWLASRVGRSVLVAGSMAFAVVPLALLLVATPATPLFFVLVAAAGALLNASLPVLLARAQELAPGREAAASGMLTGLPVGIAGVLYVGIGSLQQTLGLTPALAVAFSMTLLGAALALRAVSGSSRRRRSVSTLDVACACAAGRACAGALASLTRGGAP